VVVYRRKVRKVDREKRKYPRLDYDCPVVIPGVEGVKKITDLSCGGVFIELQPSSDFRVGQQLSLIFKLPTHGESLRVRARVKNLQSQGIGCEFVDLSEENDRIIRHYFETFKDTLILRP